MFNNSQNNSNDNKKSTNSKGLQFMNIEGFYPSTLVLGFWDEMLRIKMHPALDESKRTDTKKFDYEQSVSTALTPEKLVLLLEKIETEIIPFMGKEHKSIGLQVGGNSLLVVSTGVGVTKNNTPYLAIHKGLHEDTKKPETSIYYEFKSLFTVDNYDEQTGSYSLSTPYNSEFKLFVRVLAASVDALSGAVAHSVRHSDRFTTERWNNIFNGVANKLGVETGYKSGYNGSYSKGNGNLFGNPNNNTQSNTSNNSFNASNASSIDDLDKFMNGDDAPF